MAKIKKEKTPMDKLTSGYEDFIKNKKTIDKGKTIFDKVLKKAAIPKPRSAK